MVMLLRSGPRFRASSSRLALAQAVGEQCEAVAAEHAWERESEKNAWATICANSSRDRIQLERDRLGGDLPASFVVDIVMNSNLKPLIPRYGLDFSNMTFIGDLDLSYATVDMPLNSETLNFLDR